MKLFDRFKLRKPAAKPLEPPDPFGDGQAPSGRDVGPEIIDFLFSSMAIDAEWSIREPRGFTWWGHQLAQRIWAEPACESYGAMVVSVHAETALLREVPPGIQTLRRVAHFNRHASLSALVWNAEQRRLALHCGMSVHEENLLWAKRFLLAAVGSQAADAHVKLPNAPALFNAQADVSDHPRNGPRKEPDDALNVLRELFAPKGQGASPYTEQEFEAVASML